MNPGSGDGRRVIIPAPVLCQFKLTTDVFLGFGCSINTVYYMAPYATMILAPFALAFEGGGVVTWISTQTSLFTPVLIIFLSGVSAFCLNFSIFYVIHATTAVTFNVAGNTKVSHTFINLSSHDASGLVVSLGSRWIVHYFANFPFFQ